MASCSISAWNGEQLKKVEVVTETKPRIGVVCLSLTQGTSGVEK